jgi:hypothetical protein
MTDRPDPMMLAMLRNQDMEDLADYLNRGRLLAETPVDQLKSRWVQLMHEWVKNFKKTDHRERNDIQAELGLRRIEIPMKLIEDLIPTLQGLSIKAAVELLSAPADRKVVVEEWLQREKDRVTVPKSKKN